MTLQKRLGALEAVVEQRVEERLEEEFMALYAVLERHLSREEFLKVMRIAASESRDAEEGRRGA